MQLILPPTKKSEENHSMQIKRHIGYYNKYDMNLSATFDELFEMPLLFTFFWIGQGFVIAPKSHAVIKSPRKRDRSALV